MVSTRQMSTSLSSSTGGSSSSEAESMHRFSVITRQAASTNNALITTSSSGLASTSRPTNGGFTHSHHFSSPQGNHPQSQAVNPMMVAPSSSNTAPQQSISLLDLPIEILDKICSYVSYKKVCQIRVVSRKMNDICMGVLNSTFSRLITQMVNRFQNVKAKMPRRESARRNHPLACECDIIETCYMRLSLLQMTFGKHIERKHCCFFPGGILDEVYNVLSYIRNTPRLEKPYRVTDELFDLSTMAMEYFKDHIEPNLPDIAYFNKAFFNLSNTNRRTTHASISSLKISSELSDSSTSMPSPPQSNMVLRKGIRKIKQGMKMYNNQLSMLRSELRNCKRKSSEQGKQIADQQKLLAEQQKQTVEYANRLDENDKKNEEMSRKFSTLLQELNKCKTELQYWRSKSPATPMCTSCGQKITPIVAPEDYQALVNQGVNPEDINVIDDTDESETSSNNLSLSTEFALPDEATTAKLMAVSSAAKNLKRHSSNSSSASNSSANLCSASFLECNSATMSTSNHHTMLSIDNGTGKRSLALASTSTYDLKVDLLRNVSKQLTIPGMSEWPHSSGLGNIKSPNSDARGYPTSWFYGNADKTSNSISKLMPTDESVSAAGFEEVNQQMAAIVEATNLNLTTSYETKKARRVQKGSRCHNVSNSKRK